MARETLLNESELEFSYISNLNAYGHIVNAPSFILEDGHEYAVVWEDEEYIRTAFSFTTQDESECVAIGNTIVAGGADNKDPFAIVYDATNNYLYYLSTDLESSHKVAIYRCYKDGIVIRNPRGKTVTYGEYEKILINRSSGTKTIYSMGEAEGKIVYKEELDFSKGNMTIKPDDGKLWNEVEIVAPETLKSENIAEGVKIAGIEGSLVLPTLKKLDVDLDFSDNDVMEMYPDEGSVFSKVLIPKPPNLIPEYIAKGIDIAGIPGEYEGGGSSSSEGAVTSKAINFYDVFGNIVYSYTRDEAATLTELPPVPELEGYTAYSTGWSSSLSSVKNETAFLDVGARYSKNGVRACIAVINTGCTNKSITLNICSSNITYCKTAEIDWGDGSSEIVSFADTKTTASPQHTYTSKGRYVIGILPQSFSYLRLGKWYSSSGATSSGYQFISNDLYGLIACSGGAECYSAAFYNNNMLKHLDIKGIQYYCYGCNKLERNLFCAGQTHLNYMHYMNYSLKRFWGYPNNSSSSCNAMSTNSCIEEYKVSTGSGTLYFHNQAIKTLILTGTGIPNLSGTLNQTTLESIYVPDDLVSTCKTKSGWSTYNSIIKPLSEYLR